MVSLKEQDTCWPFCNTSDYYVKSLWLKRKGSSPALSFSVSWQPDSSPLHVKSYVVDGNSRVVAPDLRHSEVPESSVVPCPEHVRLVKGLVSLLVKEEY
ncbi:hypothetical protein TNCV_527231 [Trichonephila clavipes]|nr:hypothetical protein TNCV_527231 [Trichonephila clavipes]